VERRRGGRGRKTKAVFWVDHDRTRGGRALTRARDWSTLHGPCHAVSSLGPSCRAGPKPGYVFSPNFLIKKLFNITKFMVRKHDFTLNIDLKLFYTILVGQVVLG
jgi:hypothetical protein